MFPTTFSECLDLVLWFSLLLNIANQLAICHYLHHQIPQGQLGEEVILVANQQLHLVRKDVFL